MTLGIRASRVKSGSGFNFFAVMPSIFFQFVVFSFWVYICAVSVSGRMGGGSSASMERCRPAIRLGMRVGE
jgi:hypothetical protein